MIFLIQLNVYALLKLLLIETSLSLSGSHKLYSRHLLLRTVLRDLFCAANLTPKFLRLF
jgi:hypothetical protein